MAKVRPKTLEQIKAQKSRLSQTYGVFSDYNGNISRNQSRIDKAAGNAVRQQRARIYGEIDKKRQRLGMEKRLTPEEVMNSKFVRVQNGKVTLHNPTKKQLEEMPKRQMLVYLAGRQMQRYAVDDAIDEVMNRYGEKTAEELRNGSDLMSLGKQSHTKTFRLHTSNGLPDVKAKEKQLGVAAKGNVGG